MVRPNGAVCGRLKYICLETKCVFDGITMCLNLHVLAINLDIHVQRAGLLPIQTQLMNYRDHPTLEKVVIFAVDVFR